MSVPVLLGGGEWYVHGPTPSLFCRFGWGLPVCPGNIRDVSVSSLDSTVPDPVIDDGEGHIYVEVETSCPIERKKHPTDWGNAWENDRTPALTRTFRAILTSTHPSAQKAPPLLVTFGQASALSPIVRVREFRGR